MKATLLESRPAYTKSGARSIMVPAGERVIITGIDRHTGRFLAEYKGLYMLNFHQDQGEPIED